MTIKKLKKKIIELCVIFLLDQTWSAKLVIQLEFFTESSRFFFHQLGLVQTLNFKLTRWVDPSSTAMLSKEHSSSINSLGFNCEILKIFWSCEFFFFHNIRMNYNFFQNIYVELKLKKALVFYYSVWVKILWILVMFFYFLFFNFIFIFFALVIEYFYNFISSHCFDLWLGLIICSMFVLF